MSSGLTSTTVVGFPAPPPRPYPGPPGGTQLYLPHEVAGQLFPQLDAASQRRLTEGTIQQDLVWLADSKIVAEKTEMLFSMFLPRDLHACLAQTEATGPRSGNKSLLYSPLPAVLASSGNKAPLARKQTPLSPCLSAHLRHSWTSARLIHCARALRGVPLGAELEPRQEYYWVHERVWECTCAVTGQIKGRLHATFSTLLGKCLKDGQSNNNQ